MATPTFILFINEGPCMRACNSFIGIQLAVVVNLFKMRLIQYFYQVSENNYFIELL